MDSKLSRRDFLKLMALAPAALAARPLVSLLDREAASATPNVFIFIFDAWSANHLQLHGYPRDTMPNLTRFAERCHVFHNHYSAGSFTVPGTASLLTGLQPWTHRAVQLTAAGVAPARRHQNLFAALSKSHRTFGYSQNPYADIFLYQFKEYLDTYLPEEQFNLESRLLSGAPMFRDDAQMAYAALENNIFRTGKGTSGSLYAAMLWRFLGLGNDVLIRKRYFGKYPFGLPATDGGSFTLEKVINGAALTLAQFNAPTLAYFHFFSPHKPYAPQKDFTELFEDGWTPPEKPFHPLSRQPHTLEEMLHERRRYDQYLASWDSEFARLLGYLQDSGQLEKSIVLITSDHGELFERGEIEHITPLLASPVVHIPLLIALPGQTQRKDIRAFTSSLDVLPTIANLAGAEIPAWAEGNLLPGLGGEEDPERAIYSMDAKTASSFAAFQRFSISMIKQRHRLVYYQYPDYSRYEFYNMDADPEEMKNLYSKPPSLAKQMERELQQKIREFNLPYEN
jgi:arylsulfatase A-like enzyme